MDSSDEFEFKPLTEGLGFHKKTEKIKSEMKATRLGTHVEPDAPTSRIGQRDGRNLSNPLSSETENDLLGRDIARPASKSISELIASLPPSMDFIGDKPTDSLTSPMPTIEPNLDLPEGPRPQIFQPFAREDFKAAPKPAPLAATLPVPGSKAVKTSATPSSSPYSERLNESFNRAFPQPGRRPTPNKETRQSERRAAIEAPKAPAGLEAVPAHFGAGFLDGMVVTGMSTILLVAIVAITQVNLWALLSNARTDGPTQVHIALLFIACLQLYLLTARSFFGASLGEWAFDLQLGTNQQQMDNFYPMRVAWRSLIMTLTGFVFLPALSLVFRRDLTRFLCGLQLYVRKV